jgi:hypothetical protein
MYEMELIAAVCVTNPAWAGYAVFCVVLASACIASLWTGRRFR